MAGYNYHLRGDTNEWPIPIHGKTVIQKGEDVFLAEAVSVGMGGVVDWYGYPASQLADTTPQAVDRNYVGIAMKGSISGVTEDIPVATTGIFRKELASYGAVKVGYWVSGGSIGTSATGISGVTVVCTATSSRGVIGRCVRTSSGTTYVDFLLMSRRAGVSAEMITKP